MMKSSTKPVNLNPEAVDRITRALSRLAVLRDTLQISEDGYPFTADGLEDEFATRAYLVACCVEIEETLAKVGAFAKASPFGVYRPQDAPAGRAGPREETPFH